MNRALASTRIRKRPDQLSGRLAPEERDVYSNRANLKTQLRQERNVDVPAILSQHCAPDGAREEMWNRDL
jgi:hypothetical protein